MHPARLLRHHRRRLLRRLRHGREQLPASGRSPRHRVGVRRRPAARPTPRPPTTAAALVPRLATGPSIPEGGACLQPGCSGTIDAGYCNVCGTPGRPAGPRRHGRSAAPSADPVRRRAPAPSCPRARPPRATSPQRPWAPSTPVPLGSVATRRTGGSQRLRSARLGGGITTVRPAPEIDAAKALLTNPSVPESKRYCPKCGEPVGRGRDGKPGRSTGFCAKCRLPLLVRPEAAGRRPRRRAVRGGRVPRPRRSRLDLPRPRQERLRPLGRAQGPAQLGRPRRPRRGHRRAALPRTGVAPEHRRDLQLRHARGRRLHRHGVRRRHLAQVDPQAAHAEAPAATTRCRSTRRSPTSSRSCRRSSTSTTSAWSTATSSPTTSSRSATRSS